VDWSYQLLDEHEQQVFRAVSVFPGPFTLEAAEAVAGKGAGAAVLRLVDCSLLMPPRTTRERELVTLVAQGRTDAQIAAQLSVSARTVSSRLGRIRDKTGCRRRADLTSLALRAGLI
jgi:DNA-binding CsgD family transcriptional regulator